MNSFSNQYYLRKINNGSGFTLIEVLVAVAVISFTVPAILLLMMKQADYASVLRDKTIAHWVAENKMVELHHNHTFFKELPQREQIENVDMADREWVMKMDINKAEIWVKYTVSITNSDNEPMATLDTYLHTP